MAVYEYNNIAQHNISFAGFSSPAGTAERTFTLPFAVGHRLSKARRLELLFDLRRAAKAKVLLSLNPDTNLPYIERIREVARKYPPKASKSRCEAKILTDTKMLLDFCVCRAEVMLKAGSTFRLLCDNLAPGIILRDITLHDATVVDADERVELLLHGPLASVSIPVVEGQVLPLAITVEAPPSAEAGEHFRVDITQLSEGMPTGGMSLDIEAR